MKTGFGFIGLLAIILIANTKLLADYVVDDGSFESTIGDPNGNLTIVWLNQFTAVAGEEQITGIDVAFGFSTLNQPVDVYLWSDPNNDGNPDDAQVLSTVNGVSMFDNNTPPFNPADFTSFDIPDVTLNIGESFFVGAIMKVPGGAALIDTGSSLGHSWIALADTGNTIDPNNLAGADFPLSNLDDYGYGAPQGNFLVRANGSAAIPEPGAATLAGISILALAFTRKRRSANAS